MPKENWEDARKIEMNHEGHAVNDAALIQMVYYKHKLENQLTPLPRSTKSGAGANHE